MAKVTLYVPDGCTDDLTRLRALLGGSLSEWFQQCVRAELARRENSMAMTITVEQARKDRAATLTRMLEASRASRAARDRGVPRSQQAEYEARELAANNAWSVADKILREVEAK
jgi:hypothetical protein